MREIRPKNALKPFFSAYWETESALFRRAHYWNSHLQPDDPLSPLQMSSLDSNWHLVRVTLDRENELWGRVYEWERARELTKWKDMTGKRCAGMNDRSFERTDSPDEITGQCYYIWLVSGLYRLWCEQILQNPDLPGSLRTDLSTKYIGGKWGAGKSGFTQLTGEWESCKGTLRLPSSSRFHHISDQCCWHPSPYMLSQLQ